MSAPRRVLVIGLRRLGDLLLATALIRSLKQAWPEARIDVLAAAGSEAMLAGNPDVAEVLVFRRKAPLWPLLRRLWRRYDWSVSLQPEDRAQFLGFAAAPRRASIVPPPGQPGARWKRWFNRASHHVDLHETHAVEQYLRLVDAMGLPRSTTLVPPQSPDDAALSRVLGADWALRPYAVVHASPMYRYKAWPDASWQRLIAALQARGLQVCLSGSGEPAERETVDRLAQASGAVSLAGALSLAELATLLRGASVYVGPDTSITHLAAACGTPTVALFGPSNPSGWGPWPVGGAERKSSPWVHTAELQQRSNVWLLQGTSARYPGCIPCMQEGCERRRDSAAQCLDELAPERVIAVVDRALAAGAAVG